MGSPVPQDDTQKPPQTSPGSSTGEQLGSLSAAETTKADLVAYRMYVKLKNLVHFCRVPAPSMVSKMDKWFNLEIPDTDIFKDEMRMFRSLSSMDYVPPLRLDVLLSASETQSPRVLTAAFSDVMGRTECTVLLESWSLAFRPRPPDPDLQVATSYKHSISLIRGVYTLMHLLPSWQLRKRGFPLSVVMRSAAAGDAFALGQSGLVSSVRFVLIISSFRYTPVTRYTAPIPYTFVPWPCASFGRL
ncbi:hypothetical protein BV25DRAFT_1813075 [Artomyces pyxidatus]|uniref:Uncharacterized protein n=1 Tax=Artomyces pyxidatus TaxID=48021 RepID=A0ACB8SM91_9AGAM|nr:hypothetical protein BV25DRAFT_1813075 [Artomyces pyxidatus]